MPKTTAGRQRERCQAQQSTTSVKAHAPGIDQVPLDLALQFQTAQV